jgi:beta-lactamase class A
MVKQKRKKSANENKAVMVIVIIIITLGIPVLAIFIHKLNTKISPEISNSPIVNDTATQTESIEINPSIINKPSQSVEPVTDTFTPTDVLPTVNLDVIEIRSLNTLKTYLEYLLDTNEGKHGLSYYNIDTQEYMGIADTELYVAASSTKVPMVMYVYNAVEKGILSFDDVVEYKQEDEESGTGIIIKGEFGDTYTIKQLAEYAITYSDNCAINMLIRVCGEWNMVNYMNSLGAKVHYINQRWKTCPYDLTLYIKELISLIDSNPDHYNEIMENLIENTVAYYMSSKSILPDTIKIGVKMGINTTLPTLNETIAVFADQTYILSYCSTDIVIEESSEILKKASLAIFEYVQNGYTIIKWDGTVR